MVGGAAGEWVGGSALGFGAVIGCFIGGAGAASADVWRVGV